MPVYEYQCLACGEKFDLLRGIRERDQKAACPKCGSKASKRVSSIFGTGASSLSENTCAPSRNPFKFG